MLRGSRAGVEGEADIAPPIRIACTFGCKTDVSYSVASKSNVILGA